MATVTCLATTQVRFEQILQFVIYILEHYMFKFSFIQNVILSIDSEDGETGNRFYL
jgi:hypothetical protein